MVLLASGIHCGGLIYNDGMVHSKVWWEISAPNCGYCGLRSLKDPGNC